MAQIGCEGKVRPEASACSHSIMALLVSMEEDAAAGVQRVAPAGLQRAAAGAAWPNPGKSGNSKVGWFPLFRLIKQLLLFFFSLSLSLSAVASKRSHCVRQRVQASAIWTPNLLHCFGFMLRVHVST